MNMWQEKYRPKELSEYYGNEQIVRVSVNWINSVLRGSPIGGGLLYYGPPGTGKTTLTHLLEEVYDLPMIRRNASDSRKKDDITSLVSSSMSTPLSKKTSVLVLDEAEGLKDKYLNELIDITNLIVICNDKYEISKKARYDLIDFEFEFPRKSLKMQYAKHILDEENESIPKKHLEDVVENSFSFRDVAKNLQTAVVSGTTEFDYERTDYGLFEEVRKHFEGKMIGKSSIDPGELLVWAFDNGGSPALISKLDEILGSTRDYRSWRYIFDLVKYTSPDTVEYPYSFKKMSRIKKEVREEEKNS